MTTEDPTPVIWIIVLDDGKYIGAFSQKRFAEDFKNLRPDYSDRMVIMPDYLVGYKASDYVQTGDL